MSDALRLYRLRAKADEEVEIDADVESDSEVDNGLSAFITLPRRTHWCRS